MKELCLGILIGFLILPVIIFLSAMFMEIVELFNALKFYKKAKRLYYELDREIDEGEFLIKKNSEFHERVREILSEGSE